jgi:hypothetical protein
MPLPSFQTLCIETPLYVAFEIPASDGPNLTRIERGEVALDCYCQQCDRESLFKAPAHEYSEGAAIMLELKPMPQFFQRTLVCGRSGLHQIQFSFLVLERTLSKTGQYPSFADLAHPELRKYRSVLDKTDYDEFAKGVGLASHGIGIGAFVYMRRIFERLVEKAHTVAKNDQDWNEADYQRSRMDEKIQLLHLRLPPFLVENRLLYSILSKGIHELSEEECRQHFDAVRVGIELILDEAEAQRQMMIKVTKAKKAIHQAHQKLGTS